MRQDAPPLVDTAGDYCYAVRDGEPVAAPEWRSCRLVLTTDRLVLATSEGKQSVPLGTIEVLDPDDAPAALEGVDVAGGTPVRVGEHVLLVDAPDLGSYERAYCRAALQGEVILARPAPVGEGVDGAESEWQKARFQFEAEDRIDLEFPDGDSLEVAVGSIGAVDTDTRQVMGEQRTVIEVEHSDEADETVATHLSGTDRHTELLESLFGAITGESSEGDELSAEERQVLMALYTGVSPFEMPDFMGLGVEEVEAMYDRLLEAGVLEELRTRSEVTLNAEGRNLASEAMSEE